MPNLHCARFQYVHALGLFAIFDHSDKYMFLVGQSAEVLLFFGRSVLMRVYENTMVR